jgi:hypothetical protein
MGGALFKEIKFNLAGLIEAISLGHIGLPDLQRPFVWPNKKVRDLFDSMYRGFPVGYLLLWENGAAGQGRGIGTDAKQIPPRMLVIDGQQRLTSLYAVLRGQLVLRQNFKKELIQIAFRPLDSSFEVADAAIQRDPTWIPNISVLWEDDCDFFQLAHDYLERLRGVREVTDLERREIQQAITRLQQLESYPFTALALSPNTKEEQVGDIFVRINSKGTPLNQADFILTLMSVFRDSQRSQLEDFCRRARTPAKRGASPFNYFLEPDPDHLLRVAVGLAFRRARLEYVYSILRGKDLETGEFSDERREEQFEKLQAAQDYALDLQHWQDFFKCLMRAGFKTGQFISSRNAILYVYVFFLIARRDYGLKGPQLRTAIARWFFFVSLTGRYTGSPESAMEEDLANLREVKSGEGFLDYLDRTISAAFTADYWTITLPNDLATSAARSPGLFAYYAALNLLDARALFSELRVAELMDPIIQGTRSSLERHHLFPRAYLRGLGFESVRDTNQIANFALIEWDDNSDISDQAPAKYWPCYEERVDERMLYWHALPEGWQELEYLDFLEQRRVLIAGVIRAGFETLDKASAAEAESVAMPELSLADRLLSRLSGDARGLVEELLSEPLQDAADLEAQVAQYLQDLEGYRRFQSILDIDTARAVADHCQRLLQQAATEPNGEALKLAQTAALYFILDDDAESDTRSPSGFDDDLQVARAVGQILGG